MQDKYKIQPLEGHPVRDWTKQLEGDTRCYALDPYLVTRPDMFRLCQIIANPVHIHTEHYALMHPEVINPFSSLGKR